MFKIKTDKDRNITQYRVLSEHYGCNIRLSYIKWWGGIVPNLFPKIAYTEGVHILN